MQLRGKQVKRARLSKDAQACSEGLPVYLRKIISLLMGKIYSINCVQLVLRDAFLNRRKLDFLLLELCPSRGLLTSPLPALATLQPSPDTCLQILPGQ